MADTRLVFTLVGRDHLSRVFRQAGVSAGRLKKDLALLGAAGAVPIGAAAVSTTLALAGAMGTAGAAVGAFGLALGPQIGKIGEVSEAQKKYREAVQESGATSAEAAKAQLAYSQTLQRLPAPTRDAAVAFTSLKDSYKEWSDSLAGDTMPAVTKSFAVFGALLPKLSPMVRVTGREMDRLMTIIGGAVSGGSMDRMMAQWTRFSESVLRGAVDGIVHLSRTMQGFDPNGGAFGEFLAFGREHGPLVVETLKNLALAAGNVLTAGGQLGITALNIANGFAKMVNAMPPGFLSVLLQLYAAYRLLSTVTAGVVALAAASRLLGRHILTMAVAASGAVGPLASLRAAFMALGTAARFSVIIAGVALLAVGLSKLANIGRAAPPNIDRLTTALGKLGASGRVTGELAKTFGKDLEDLNEKISALTDPSKAESVQQWIVTLGGIGDWDSTPVKEAKKNLDGIDQALANLVKDGKADLAAAALERLKKAYREGGGDVSDLKGHLDAYNSALEDAKFEAQLAAQSMGLFGKQAQETASKLAEQKRSADGLRQAIQALNDVQRAGLGGMIGFEAAIDAAAKAAKENAGALRMVGGELDLNSPKAQAAATALQDLASKTDEAAGSARESGRSWSYVNGIYERGRKQLIQNAMQMGLTRAEAKALADQILKTPDKTAMLRADISDWKTKISEAEKQLKNAKGDKKAKLTADILNWKVKVAEAEQQLKNAKSDKRAKLTADIGVWKARVAEAEHQLKTAKGDKKAKLTANISDWQSKISAAQRQINALPKSKTTTLTVRRINEIITKSKTYRSVHDIVGATGGYYTGRGFRTHYSSGGPVRGPGTGTSDDVPWPWLSNGEFVIKAAAVRKYGEALFQRLNAMRMPKQGLQTGMALAGGMTPATAMAGTAAGGEFTGNLYLDSGEFLGAVRGVVKPMIRDAQDEAAYRQKVGRR
ncbi:hypothetical protein [Streptomyces sp. NPDC055058]